MKAKRNWRTRVDSFLRVKDEIENILLENPFVLVKDLFTKIDRLYPGQYKLNQMRTLQRIVKSWRESNVKNKNTNNWLMSLIQGKINLNELILQYKNILKKNDLELLNHCILSKSLTYRNKAVTILSYLKYIPNHFIANFLLLSPKTIRSYIRKFESGGVNKLIDIKRKIVKKSENKEYIDAVFKILHEPPSLYNINRTSWKMDDIYWIMAENNLPISRFNIRQIIKNAGYRFRKAKKVLTSTDPLYREKLKEITRILQSLKAKEKFFSIDEFGPFAVKKKGGRALVSPNEQRTYPQWQKSKGSLILTAALELSTNQIIHFYSLKKNTTEMIKLLNLILETYSDQDCIYFSWDAASWHASKELYKKVEAINSVAHRKIYNNPLVRLAPLPACAQFLNVIESVFSGMAKAIIHNSNYSSVDESKTAIDRYLLERNEYFRVNPKKAGNKIWGKEIVKPVFNESNNCKDSNWR